MATTTDRVRSGTEVPFAPDDAPTQRAARLRRVGSWADRLVAVGFVVALLIPGIALAAGIRPPGIENRRLAELPALTGEAMGDPAFFAAIDRAVSDWFPFKANAVRWLARLDYRLLGGTANPDVTVGEGEWLFLTNELRPRCDFDAQAALEKVDAAAGALQKAGVEFRYVVAPDKHAIYPEKLNDDLPLGTPCSDAQREVLKAGMQARPDHAVELWTGIMAAKTTAEVPLYYEQDAHWTPHGALPGFKAVVESLAPGTWNDDEVVIDGVHEHNSDLARLMGLPRRERTPRITMRPDVRIDRTVIDAGVDITNARDITWYTVTTDRPTVPGRTLVVYDSFYANVAGFLVPWFEESVWVHQGDLHNFPAIAAALPDFDNVIFERVERSAYFTDPEADLRPVAEQEQARAGETGGLPGVDQPPAEEPGGVEEPPVIANPDVMAGNDGWLFLTDSLAPRCDFGAGELLGQIDRTALALEELGIGFRFVIAPDKNAIYPEQVAEYPSGTPCTDEQRPALRTGLQRRSTHAIETWSSLEERRAQEPDLPMYYEQDAHWTPHGALVVIRQLVESLAPGTWQPDEVTVEGVRHHPSDLARLIDKPTFETIPGVSVRPAVVPARTPMAPPAGITPARDFVRYTVDGDVPVVPGRTLIVYDSFFAISTAYMTPWFEESVWVHHGDLFNYPALAEALPPLDHVVFQRTERSIYWTDPEELLRPVVEAQRTP